jgi:protein tyrosine/serine phosphatase
VFATRLPDLPIENAAKIADGVYRGAQPDAAGLKALKEMGVRTVVNLRSHHSEKKEVEALGLEAVEIPMEASLESEPPTDAEMKRFFDVVLDPAKRPVYFHCAKGKDRTGTMAALYRIEVDGWSREDAIAELRHFGYHEYYKDLVEFVRTYKTRGFRPPTR